MGVVVLAWAEFALRKQVKNIYSTMMTPAKTPSSVKQFADCTLQGKQVQKSSTPYAFHAT